MNNLTLSQLIDTTSEARKEHTVAQGVKAEQLSVLVKEGWNTMMLNASLRALVVADVLTISLVEGFEDVQYAERNRARAEEFRNRYLELSEIELSSKTYIKAVLVPLKQLREDITEYIVQNDSVKEKLGGRSTVNKIFRAAAKAEAEIA